MRQAFEQRIIHRGPLEPFWSFACPIWCSRRATRKTAAFLVFPPGARRGRPQLPGKNSARTISSRRFEPVLNHVCLISRGERCEGPRTVAKKDKQAEADEAEQDGEAAADTPSQGLVRKSRQQADPVRRHRGARAAPGRRRRGLLAVRRRNQADRAGGRRARAPARHAAQHHLFRRSRHHREHPGRRFRAGLSEAVGLARTRQYRGKRRASRR